MKLRRTIYPIGFVVLLSTPLAFAVTSDEVGTATIFAPLNITSSSDLRFGDVSPDLLLAGTVEIETDGDRVCSNSLTCFDTSPTGAATFTVSGAESAVYDISIPATITLNGSDTAVGHSMNATIVASKATGTLAGGTDTFTIGGTLSVGADQTPGTYDATFTVSVQYQ